MPDHEAAPHPASAGKELPVEERRSHASSLGCTPAPSNRPGMELGLLQMASEAHVRLPLWQAARTAEQVGRVTVKSSATRSPTRLAGKGNEAGIPCIALGSPVAPGTNRPGGRRQRGLPPQTGFGQSARRRSRTLPSGSGKERPRKPGTGRCSAIEYLDSVHPRFGWTHGRQLGHVNRLGGDRVRDWTRQLLRRAASPESLDGDSVSRPSGPSGPGERGSGLRADAGAPTQSSDSRGPAVPTEGRRESLHSCHKEKPLDVALRAVPLGPALLREGAQVGSAVFQRFAAGRSREGGWSGCRSCRSRRFAGGTGFGSEQERQPPHARTGHFGAASQGASAPRRCGRATTTARHGKPSIGEAHGSIGRPTGGNAGRTQRTSQRTKALRSRKPRKRCAVPPRSRGATTRRRRRDQRREGKCRGGPVPRAESSFAMPPFPGLPGKDGGVELGWRTRLTRDSCCGGESSEGCDAIGKGHGKPNAFPGATAPAREFFGVLATSAAAAGW